MIFHCTPASLDVLDNNSELLQTSFWAGVKARFGWQPLCLQVQVAENSYSVLVLCKTVLPGMGLAYIPYPGIPEPQSGREELLGSLALGLAPLLPAGTRFIRFDLAWFRTEADGSLPVLRAGRNRLFKAPMDIQPPSTVLLDLNRPEEDVLRAMKQKTRYNIGLAEKKGVHVADETAAYETCLPIWYRLYRETAARDKIMLHSYDYYRQLFESARTKKSPLIKLLMAHIEGEPVAGIIVIFNGKQAVYLYGASNNVKRNFMPNHLLQWQAIRLAAQAGCTTYDFFGIPEKEDPHHPMHGLYRFKTGFGGNIIHRYGCYDYSLSPVFYTVYRIAEAVRKFYFKRLRKIIAEIIS